MITKYNPIRFVILLVAILGLSACAPQVKESPVVAAAQDDPITLRMGIPDGDNVLYAPYVLEFIQQANTLSNGSVTIVPTWQAGDSTSAGARPMTPALEGGRVEVETRLDLQLAP